MVLIEKAAYPGSVDFIGKAQIAGQTGEDAFAQGVRSFERCLKSVVWVGSMESIY